MAVYDSPSPTDIDPSTLARLRRVLQSCGPFNSDRALQAVFVDTRLAPWRDNVPEADTATARVDALISYLLLRQNSQAENALLLFLQVLRDRTNPKDNCANQLDDVINMLTDRVPPDPTQSSAPPGKYAGETNATGRRRAYQLLEERDSERALKQALDIFHTMQDQEGQVESFYRLGDLAQRQQRAEEALHYFEEALKIDGRHVPSLVSRAAILLAQNKPDEARQALAQASELAPQDEDVRALQARFEEQQIVQQRAALDTRIQALESHLSSETNLPQPFRESIDNSLKQAKALADRGNIAEAIGSLEAGEAVWTKWDSQRQEWLGAYEFQRKLIEEIASLGGESGFRLRLSAAQQDAAGRAAEFDTPVVWRQELEQLQAAVIQFREVQERLNQLRRRLDELPAEQRAPFVQAESDLRQKLEQMPLDDAAAWSSLENGIGQQETTLATRIQELASVPPRERQYWLVVANPEFFDWRRAFAAAPDSPPISWTEAKGDLNQNRLRQAHEGDLVLAYTSASDERAIVGLAHIVGNPYPHKEGLAVNIAPDRLLPTPITLEMLRDAIPETEKVRISQIGVAAVTPFEWSVIRELIRYHNPDLGPDDLPSATVPPDYHPVIDNVEVKTDPLVGKEARGQVTVRNRGNVTWERGTPFDIAVDSSKFALTMPQTELPEDIPPGSTVSTNPTIRSAESGTHDLTWTFTLHVGDESYASEPYQMSVTVREAEPEETLKEETLPANGQTISITGETGPDQSPPAPETVSPRSEQPKPVSAPLIIGWLPLPEPPADEGRIIVDVDDKTVSLTLNDKTEYRSRNKLPHQELEKELLLTPVRYGQKLFDGLINQEAAVDFEGRSTAAGYIIARDRTQGKLRWQLRVAADSQAYPYKWEFLSESDEKEKPLAVREFSPFYRLQGGRESIPPLAIHPVNILFVIANPVNLAEGLPPINRLQPLLVDKELDVIRRAMAPLVEKGWVSYEVLHSAAEDRFDLDTIKERLEKNNSAPARNIHALHLVAHGVNVGDDFMVVLENKAREFSLIAAKDFVNIMTVGDDLRLIVLATCLSAAPGQMPLPGAAAVPAAEAAQQFQETGRVYRSLASDLVKAGIPAVIAMQKNMPIDAAQVFTQRFYGDLARSGRIDMAMAATRHDLYTAEPNSWTWGIPVLIMGQQDGKLFEIQRESKDTFRPPLAQLDRRPLAQLGSASAVDANSLTEALQSLLANRLDQPPPTPDLGPPTQDPPALDRALTHPVRVSGQALQAYVLQNSGIELAPGVFAQIASALNAGKHIILTGPPGTGKTSLAQDICAFAAQPDAQTRQVFTPGGVLATATADWTTFDTVGGYVPTPQQTLQFRLGIFLEAIRTGKWLIIDEINRAEIDKAFGELFTVLSGQAVTLPYRVGTKEIRVLPCEKGVNWYPAQLETYDYTIHPNWRIIGTMNVYDKSSLFAMSLAFMRRFAFIDLDLPGMPTYNWLVDKWLSQQQLALQAKTKSDDLEPIWETISVLQQAFRILLDRTGSTTSIHNAGDENPLMERRALGPAIVKDMIEYIGDRYRQETQNAAPLVIDPGIALPLMAEAFMLFVVPQLDALDYEGIRAIYLHLRDVQFTAASQQHQREQIEQRIKLLYPHIRDWT